MIMECPSDTGIPTFGTRFSYIVKQSSPTQPQIISNLCYIVYHLQCMIEIILMPSSVFYLYTLQGHKFRENQFQQSATV